MNSLFKLVFCLVLVSETTNASNVTDIKQQHQKASVAERKLAEQIGISESSRNVLKLINTNKAASPDFCTIGGGSCSFDSDCCSGNCYSGTCQAGAGGCTVGGGSCSFDSDCCSSNCSSGTCQSGTGCTNGGGSCSFDSDCCSGNCRSGACQAACISTGESCTYDHECCGGNCNSHSRCGSEPNCIQ